MPQNVTVDHQRAFILNGIIARGGIYSGVAQMYLQDETKADAFIKECFLQCHNRELWDYWGLDLMLEIISYRLLMLRLLYEECLFLQAQLVRS